ncbi:MAG: hypothetical protein H6673_10480 [Anaerolineales bacterium]|nr:hypothetical protein [Anaerolineales bacterium]
MQIIYTAHLHAQFEWMPHIFTQIRQLRESPSLLLDLGGVSSPENWVCQATENRAAYIILDAMGYHVAYADGLTTSAIIGLQPQVQVRLLDNSIFYRWTWREWSLNVGPTAPAPSVTWAIESSNYQPQAGRLVLEPRANHLGLLRVQWPDMTILKSSYIPFDLSTPPDPTITAAIEFVEREARFYEQKQRGDSPHES